MHKRKFLVLNAKKYNYLNKSEKELQNTQNKVGKVSNRQEKINNIGSKYTNRINIPKVGFQVDFY